MGGDIDECTADVASVRRGPIDLGVDCESILQYNVHWFSILPSETCSMNEFFMQCCVTCESYLFDSGTIAPEQTDVYAVEATQSYSGITDCDAAAAPIADAYANYFGVPVEYVTVTPVDSDGGCGEGGEADFDVSIIFPNEEGAEQSTDALADDEFADQFQPTVDQAFDEAVENASGEEAAVLEEMSDNVAAEEVSEVT